MIWSSLCPKNVQGVTQFSQRAILISSKELSNSSILILYDVQSAVCQLAWEARAGLLADDFVQLARIIKEEG